MTRLVASASLAAAILVGVPGLVAAQTAVSGTWTLVVDGPEGSEQAALTLVVDGGTLRGRISSERGESAIAGTVNGTSVRFSFDLSTANGQVSITASGTVSGDDIKGDMDYGSGSAPFTGKRTER